MLTEKNKEYIERAKARQNNKLKKFNTMGLDGESPNLAKIDAMLAHNKAKEDDGEDSDKFNHLHDQLSQEFN